MKARKFLALLLAALMVLGVVPMTLVSVSADDAVATAAPTKLPNGNAYLSKALYSSDLTWTYAENNNKWPSGFQTFTAKPDSGLMFTIDTSSAPAGTDLTRMYIMLNTTVGVNSTSPLVTGGWDVHYLSLTTKPAFASSTDATSDWYVSTDGASWTTVTSSYETGSYLSLGSTRGVLHVYVPLSSGYLCTTGDNIVGTGAADGDGDGVATNSYLDALSKSGGFRINGMRVSVDGTDVGKALTITNFRVVSDFYDNASLPLYSSSFTWSYSSNNNGWPSGFQSFVASENTGIMFTMDTSSAPAGTDLTRLYIMLNTNVGVNSTSPLVSGGWGVQYLSLTVGPAFAASTGRTADWYLSTDGVTWSSVTAAYADGSYINLGSTRGVVHVYIPLSSGHFCTTGDNIKGTGAGDGDGDGAATNSYLDALSKSGGFSVTGMRISAYDTTVARSLKITDFRVVNNEPLSYNAPEKLPNGNPYFAEDLYNNDYTWTYAANSGKWPGGIQSFSPTASSGLMFAMDTSMAPAGTDVTKLMIMMNTTVAVNSTDPLVTGGWNVKYLSLTVKPAFGNTSTDKTSDWYVSADGTSWTKLTAGYSAGSYMDLGSTRGVLYVYIPLASGYFCTTGDNIVGTGAADGDGDGAATNSYLDVLSKSGGFSINGMSVTASGSTAVKSLKITDFRIVNDASAPDVSLIQNVSATLTDGISYNLYAKLPATTTASEMVFDYNGRKMRVQGVEQANGTLKYTLPSVLPQNMTKQIKATLTITAAGVTVTDTYTSTVADYLESLLASSSYATQHDLVTALLHYGAAAQTVAGQTGTLMNEGIAALPYPTDRTALPYTYNNGAKAIWTSAALRLNGTIELKVGLNAPEGVTAVQYTVGSKTGIAEIKNGYAYIPVNAYQMMDAITIKCYNGTGVTEDGALTISASYYLAKADTDNAATAALIAAVADYAVQATIVTGGRTAQIENDYATLAQMSLTDDVGGLFNIVQLMDGSFIIIDGGLKNEANEDLLWAYLWQNSGYTKPVISAWIFTHLDVDHTGNAFNFLRKYSGRIDVEMIGWSTPDVANFAAAEGDSETTANYKASAIAQIESQLNIMSEIKQRNPDTTIWEMTAGESVMIGEVKVDVLYDASVIIGTCETLNDLCSVFKLTFTQGTDATTDDKTYMVLGDSPAHRTAALLDDFSTSVLKSDVLQASHHGLYGGDLDTYKSVAPTVTLIPSKQAKLENHESGYYAADFNVWLRENSTVYYHDHTQVVNMTDLTVSAWK